MPAAEKNAGLCRLPTGMQTTKPTVLITGVTGFAGSAVAGWFLARGYRVIGASRRPPTDERIEFRPVSKIDRYTFWEDALKDVDVVLHLAARAHQMKETVAEQQLYYEVNVEGSENLARQSAAAGVRHFIFISSTKAMLGSSCNEVLSESCPCAPVDPYGISKLKAEMEIARVGSEKNMPYTILRPPLMYGPGVKGNMASLIRLVRFMPFLPLGGIENRRSLLGIKNMASAIETVIDNKAAYGRIFLLSDGEMLSTSELVKRLAKVYNPSCRIVDMPRGFWKFCMRLPWLSSRIDRLTGSLAVDSSLFASELNWKPPFAMQQQLQEMIGA